MSDKFTKTLKKSTKILFFVQKYLTRIFFLIQSPENIETMKEMK